MNFWKSLSGVVELELTSAVLPEALGAINAQAVEIRNLQWKNDLTCRFQTDRKHLRKLKALVDKRGETLRICKKSGLYWRGNALLRRPILVGGFLLILTLTYLLPSRILFVRVEGNHEIPDRQILEAAEKMGVAFGSSRRELRSEKVKNGVLSELPKLQWVGVNTAGCTAIVNVRERSDSEQTEPGYPVSHIVAAGDGYILSGIVEQGTGMFQPGQAVQKGQLLISGYTDCGFCIRAGRAKGEILAQTSREILTVTPENCLVPRGNRDVKRKISLLIRKKRINLWKDSGISPVTCGRMYAEYYVTLPGGFRLPVALCVDTYTQRDMIEGILQEADVSGGLREFSRQYLQQRMISGSIRKAEEQITNNRGLFQLRGNYICEEMIGRELPEQIGVTNGKND